MHSKSLDASNALHRQTLLDVDINRLQCSKNYNNLSTVVQEKVETIRQELANESTVTRSLVLEAERRNEEHQRLKAFLDSLKFDGMGLRESQIQDSYKDTFEWMLEEDRNIEPSDRPWYDFPQWLQSDQGIYWVNGKPGTGKSTVSIIISSHQVKRSDFLNFFLLKRTKVRMNLGGSLPYLRDRALEIISVMVDHKICVPGSFLFLFQATSCWVCIDRIL